MTLRETRRHQGRRRLALLLPPILIAMFAIVICQSSSNDLWAQGSKTPPPQKPGAVQPAKPAPAPNKVEVERLVSLKTQFLEELNQALQNPDAQARMHLIFHKSIGPEWVTESLIKWDAAAKVAPLSQAQLQAFRDVTARQIDEAIKLEQAGKGGARMLGNGSIRNHLFTGQLRPVTGPVALPAINSESAK